MTTSAGGKPSSVVDAFAKAAPNSPLRRLELEPYQFEFFQAVRLIVLTAASAHRSQKRAEASKLLSKTELPYEESVHFRAHSGHAFPASQIVALSYTAASAPAARPVPEMMVTFLGLAGQGGYLPAHYTQALLDTVRRKDFAFRDFLDLFNHRLIAQFYRAWEKSRLPVRYEQAQQGGGQIDAFSAMFYSLVGLGALALRDRQVLPDDISLYYGGHFARRPRSAMALRQLITDCFGVAAEVQQFQGQWLVLPEAERTQLVTSRQVDGKNQLGVSAIAGSRVWGVENKFRLRLCVLCFEQFCKFLPGGDAYVPLTQLVRLYVGPAIEFEIQLVLVSTKIPLCELKENGTVRLGWTSWLPRTEALEDVDDAVFAGDGWPNH